MTRKSQPSDQDVEASSGREKSRENLEHGFSINRAILDTLYDAVVMTDLEGHIQTVNLALERMFGYSQHELIGQPVTLLMPREVAHHHGDYMHPYDVKPRYPSTEFSDGSPA
jgi:PAS domain S-box-containing protein